LFPFICNHTQQALFTLQHRAACQPLFLPAYLHARPLHPFLEQATKGSGGGLVLTDANGRQAHVVALRLGACDAAVYVLDRVCESRGWGEWVVGQLGSWVGM